jgi:hypothetical protein
MGKRKHRDRDERLAREARRKARAQASLMRQQLLDAGVPPNDIVDLKAEGFVGKRAHTTGELVISATPPDENESHDPTTTTG